MEKAFISCLTEIRTKIRIRNYKELGLRWLMLSLLLLLTINILMKMLPGLYINWKISYPMILIFGMVLVAIIQLIIHKGFLKELEEIDKINQLNERLSTAYECYLSQKKTIMIAMLYRDVVQNLDFIGNQLKVKKIFNRNRLVTLIILIVLFSVSLFSFSSHIPDDLIGEKLVISKVVNMLKNFSKNKLSIKDDKPVSPVMQKIKDVTELAERNQTNRKALLQTIDELGKQLVRERKQLMGDLTEQLSAGTDFKPNLAESFSEMDNQKNSLDRMKQQLNIFFDNQLPDDIANQFEDLENNEITKELMEQIKEELAQSLDNSNQGRQGADEKTSESNAKDLNEEKNNLQNNSSQLGSDQKLDNRQKHDLNNKANGLFDPSLKGDGHNSSGKNLQDDDMKSGFNSITAGTEKDSHQKKNQPYELKTENISPTQTEGLSTQGKGTSTIIQSLMKIGVSKTVETEIFRQYQEKLEQVIEKEDIPMEHRGSIKDYFLSIGMNTESKRR
jgi:hypothetical protein